MTLVTADQRAPSLHAPTALTSRISWTSHAVSSISSFSWAVPSTLSVLNSPLCGKVQEAVRQAGCSTALSLEPAISGLPLVDHFELDALGLDGPSEATVATVDAEFELFFKFYAGKEGRMRRNWLCGSVHWLWCVCVTVVVKAPPQVPAFTISLV